MDDQFALAYALRSEDRIDLEAVYAAPFFNDRSTGPKDGMERSYREIKNILRLLDTPMETVFRGSTDYLKEIDKPQKSEAVEDLVERAMASADDDPLYVVAIGAITNVASAMLIEPEIIKKISRRVAGRTCSLLARYQGFNLGQDVLAARIIFDSGVPLVQIPCMGLPPIY